MGKITPNCRWAGDIETCKCTFTGLKTYSVYIRFIIKIWAFFSVKYEVHSCPNPWGGERCFILPALFSGVFDYHKDLIRYLLSPSDPDFPLVNSLHWETTAEGVREV